MKANLLIAFLAICGIANAQAPDWQWAKSAGESDKDEGTCVALDSSGNTYVAGYFASSTITFGSITLTNAGVTGSEDIFIAKYDNSGNVLWAKSVGESGNDLALGIAVDGCGNSFVAGFFESPTITFGSTTLTNIDNTGGTTDIFIAKYDNNGNVLWAKSAGGSGFDEEYSIAVDRNGNSYVTGSFLGPTITFGSTTLTNAGVADIFVAKYSKSGKVLWAKSVGGSGYDVGYGIAVDGCGNSYVTGSFFSPTITFGSATLTNAGVANIFIAKYDNHGNVLWAKSAGGTNVDGGESIAVDRSRNVHITGYFNSIKASFGSITLHNPNRFGNTADIFVAKYDNSGNVLWAKRPEVVSGGNDGNSIAVDGSGNSYVTGQFDGSTITFGSITLTNADITGKTPDVFIAKYNAEGGVLWVKSVGGNAIDIGFGITVDENENSYITGYFESPTITFGSTTLNNAGNADIFVAKLGDVATGINETLNNENIFQIYPNPFSSQTTLQTDKILKDATLTVYNSIGRQVKQIKNIFGPITLERDNLPGGIYFIRLTQDNKTIATEQVIIAN